MWAGKHPGVFIGSDERTGEAGIRRERLDVGFGHRILLGDLVDVGHEDSLCECEKDVATIRQPTIGDRESSSVGVDPVC